MRLAILSDIHGNLPALEAVHSHLRQWSCDLIVNLGDCLAGPMWPERTAQYLMAENWPTVRGNHDRILVTNPEAEPDKIDAFVHRQLSRSSLDWVAALPATLVLEPGLLLCHGTPTDDETALIEEDGGDHWFPSNEWQIRAKLGNVSAELILCGHTHTPRVARISERQTILNPGSVGVQAFSALTVTGSPHARYAIATRRNGIWSFAQHAIDYDWTAAAQQAAACGFARWSHGLLTGFSAVSAQG